MGHAISHITLVVENLDRTQRMLEEVLDARLVYDSGPDQFSIAEERFLMIGDLWLAIMKGAALKERSYNHVAFYVEDAELDERAARIEALGLEIRPPRPRVAGEGRSVYFYGPDNHLFELHSGSLDARLARYAAGPEAAG